MSDEVRLPAVVPNTTTALDQITAALGVPRDVLPPDAQIASAWSGLDRLVGEIPEAYRTEHHLRMCVAVAAGLFDSAINYAWNAAILRLRERVRTFGFSVVQQFTGKPFDEDALLNLKDSELLDLMLRLNLISEDGFFFLDQSRDVRNNFSSAHPAMGKIDDIEFAAFVNRCTQYALSDTEDPRGIDSQEFITALKSSRFTADQRAEWHRRLQQTHAAQRDLLFGTLHGVYCDPASSQETRLNSLELCQDMLPDLTDQAKSRAITQHSQYVADGLTDRVGASQDFFTQLSLLTLLNQADRHRIFVKALQSLMSVHQGYDNFYNEPPFAERLLELAEQMPVPPSAQEEFVDVVLTCAAGNQYGVSNAAVPTYQKLVRNFSPREVRLMLRARERNTILASRLKTHSSCHNRFKKLVALLDPQSVSPDDQAVYDWWIT